MADGVHNHVAIQIEAMLASAQPLFSTKCCIYRVPHKIHELNQSAYTPNVVSVGPLHHGDTKLLPMESHKQVYCLSFIERCRSKKVNLDDLFSCVQELEPEFRQCYSDKIKFIEEELVKMILVDCGFVIELFLRYYYRESTQDDVILLKPWLKEDIRMDLLLLENQLPFFILDKLYNSAFDGDHPSFLTLALRYFKAYTGKNPPLAGGIAHFTDLLRTSHLQPNKQPPRKYEILDHLYSATELNEAGVKFGVNDKSDSFLDLQLSGRYLKIPQIDVTDWTEVLLRNLVALEQCHYPNESFISDYVLFLDFLINTDKDVDVLVKNGIFKNLLGDCNAVATMFNGLDKNILHANFNTDYLCIANKLNKHYKHPLHSIMATLRRDYCNTPWTTVASITGIALLILTIIQTVFSILQAV